MFGRITRYWRGLSVAAFLSLPNIWQGIKWVWDWFGRLDLFTNHLSNFRGIAPVTDFLTNPPPWTIFPSIVLGVLVILWDVRRQDREGYASQTLDLNQKLLVGFHSFCAAIAIAIWVMAWPLYFPAKAAVVPATPIPPAPVAPPKPPPPPPPWVTQDEIEQQRKLGRTLLIYSPQEFAALSGGGQNLKVYENKWVKVDYPIVRVPAIEVIDKKEYYVVYVAVEIGSYTINNRYMAAYFDPKKWADRLLGIRNGSKLSALCQFMGPERRLVSSYFSDVQLGYNCELS
jgi:hypothetical protein